MHPVAPVLVCSRVLWDIPILILLEIFGPVTVLRKDERSVSHSSAWSLSASSLEIPFLIVFARAHTHQRPLGQVENKANEFKQMPGH